MSATELEKSELAEARKAYGMKRPLHKMRIAQAALQAERDRKHPEPMSIFHKREKQKEIPEVKLPKPMVTLGQIEKASFAMSQWENSDPFSFDRTALHLKQGYLNADDVIKEMGQRTLARRAAKVREVDNAKR